MSEHRYPAQVLLGDYARAGAGLLLTGAPLVLVRLNLYVGLVLGLLVVLFAVFAGLTLLRQLRPIELGDDGIEAHGLFPVRLSWDALEKVSLRYFATRRDGQRGWMELRLGGAGGKLQLDSRIDGFRDIAARAARAAARRQLSMTPATATNFAALGIPLAPSAGE